MGTSTSLPTPSGGGWTKLKNDITDYLSGSTNVTYDQIIGGTIVAAGGLDLPSPSRLGSGSAGSGASGGGAGGGRVGGRASVGRAVSQLGCFAAAVRDGGLDAGLRLLGLDELRNRPAAEVIARISEHLADGVEGLQEELLRTALQEAILETAAIEGESGYHNLSGALQSFLSREGVEGLIESFLTHYVLDRVWAFIQNHVERRSDSVSSASALESAVENSCRGHVRELMDDMKRAGRFDRLDWFGTDGQRFGQDISVTLESRLSALARE